MNTNTLRIALALIVTFAGVAPASAQQEPSRVQLSLYPSSRILARGGDSVEQPKFKTYSPGASVTVALSRHFSLEGDIAGSRGSLQTLGVLGRKRSPAMLAGYINGVVNLRPGHKVQPYATAGLGLVRLFKREDVDMARSETLESANVGAGVKVMFGGWGIRADYRFVGMDSTAEDRSNFFGPGVRKAHRVAVGFIIGAGR
jgi:hypothetical protein